MTKKRVEIYSIDDYVYSDSKKGFATLVYYNGDDIVVYGGKENISRVRMELIGIVYALYYVKKQELEFDDIDIISTYPYIISGINKNIYKWISKGEEHPNMDCWNIIWKYIVKYNSRKKKVLQASWFDDGKDDKNSDKAREIIERRLEIKAKYDESLKRMDNYI